MEQKLEVKGMTCSACVRFVQTFISKQSGIEKVEVSLENEEAIVTSDSLSNIESLIVHMNEKTNYQISKKP